MEVRILGVKIDDIDEKTALLRIGDSLSAEKKIFIATPNPEMLVLAQKDTEFKDILNSADMLIPDGAGLIIGARILGKKIENRLAGIDLMNTICVQASKAGYGVYLLGAEQGIARTAAGNLKKTIPELKICGAESGGIGEEWDNRVIIEHINAVRPDILFVALGHGRQERWIAKNFSKLGSVKLAMGVGGAFDFISGKVRRAPFWMRKIGIEWLWRLIQEPKRFKRIFTAVIIFPTSCLLYGRKK